MSPRPTDKPHDLRVAVVRAVESYSETFYSDIDKDAKQEADEKLLRCMKAFLANNGWDKFVSFLKLR
jgi:acyl-coenzyme A thioesterase PaaI-like protein